MAAFENKQSATKRAGMLLGSLLAIFALVLAFAPGTALADEAENTSVDPFDYLLLDVSASTDGLPDDQVQVTVTGTNKVGMELIDHKVSFKTPDGWTLVSGSETSEGATTNDGDTVSTTAVLAKKASDSGAADTDANGTNNTNGAKASGKTPNTGDNSATIAAVAIAVVLAAAALYGAKKLRFKATLSLFLAALLVLNMIPNSALKAMADEVNGTATTSSATTTDASTASPFSVSKNFEVDVRGEKLTVTASVSCNTSSDAVAPGVVNLQIKRAIPVDSSTVSVSVLSEVAYAGSSENVDEKCPFDESKIALTGSLTGATVREGAYTVKVAGKNEDSSELEDRTHYELRFIIDGIPDGAAEEDSDYGYIELSNQPFADTTQGYGVACVSYSKPSGYIAQVGSQTPLDGDADNHTFANGKYYDGNNRFRVPVELDGVEVGLPIPATSEFARYANGDTFTVNGVEYRTFTSDDILNGISFNTGNENISVVECVSDLDYTWLTFEVEGETGYAAYKQLTDALTEAGLLFGGQITSTYSNTIVYPKGLTTAEDGTKNDPFVYAETSPVAYAYAVQVKRGEQDTTITYLAGLHSSQELKDDETDVGDVDLLDTTTFSAYRVSTSEDGSSTEARATDVAVSVYDADSKYVDGDYSIDKDLFKMEVTVPNDTFDSDPQLAMLDPSDSDSYLAAMYTYLGNVKLRMTDGSINAFGVPEKDVDVALFDGVALNNAAADDGESVSTDAEASVASIASLSDDDNSNAVATASVVSGLVPGQIVGYKALGAAPVVNVDPGRDVKAMDTIYRKSGETEDDSKASTIKRVKAITLSAVSTGLGINHAVNLVKVLGPGLLNYVTAGFTIVGLLGVFISDLLPKETEKYTVDDVMAKLDEMNAKLDTIDTTVKTINVKLDEQSAQQAWQQQASTYTNLSSLLSSKTTSNFYVGMDNVLKQYMELDENGKETTTPCSRTTSVSRMPEKAIKALKKYLNGIDESAANKGFSTGISGAYTTLRNVLLVNNGLVPGKNMLDIYYDYVNTCYNWDVETKIAKRAFLASLMVMYNNAYALYSAKLSVELYEANASGDEAEKQTVWGKMEELREYSEDISKVLYGEVDWDQVKADYPGESKTSSVDPSITVTDFDAEKLLAANAGKTVGEVLQEKYLTPSKYLKAVEDTSYTEVKFIATDATRQRTYSLDNYALTAAYDETCFAKAYVTGYFNQLTNSWKPTCSFTEDELQTMVKRLNALPASLRPTITITNADGTKTTRPVENIAEEMEAIGFKTQNPTSQFKKQLLTVETSVQQAKEEKIIGNKNSALWANNGSTTDVWATVSVADATKEVDRYSDEAHNWNYFFTEFGYKVARVGNKKVRLQYAHDLSDGKTSLISNVDMGNTVSDPQNYIVLSVNDAKGTTSKWGGSGYGNDRTTMVAGRWGTVFNLKTGAVVKNQLLYAVEMQVPVLPWLKSETDAIRVDYYPFGVLNVDTKGHSAMLSDYASWYQTNWYSKTDSDAARTQNETIDIWRNNSATD